MYTTPYGPIVDGVVIPADPQLLMDDPGAGNNYPRYDIMFGLTESESFHLFPASTGKAFSLNFSILNSILFILRNTKGI